MDLQAAPHCERKGGVYEWTDQYGNRGTEIVYQRSVAVRSARCDNLFQSGHGGSGIDLAQCFSCNDSPKRRTLVVVDSSLPHHQKTLIEEYFARCKTARLLEDCRIVSFAASFEEKLLRRTEDLIRAAKEFGLKRKDYFVAVGGPDVTDIVGFAAAIYRRSTPWILVSTSLVGFTRASTCENRLSLNHVGHDGTLCQGALTLSHPPIINLFDASLLESPSEDQLRCSLAAMIRDSIVKHGKFSHVEACVASLSAVDEGKLCPTAMVDLASSLALADSKRGALESHLSVLTARFPDTVTQVADLAKGVKPDNADSIALGVAFVSALSTVKGKLSKADLARLLALLQRARLPVFDKVFEAPVLWEHLIKTSRTNGVDSLVIPESLGMAGILQLSDFSQGDVDDALSILHTYSPTTSSNHLMIESVRPRRNSTATRDSTRDEAMTEDVQYHVASVSHLFNESNPTMIQNYCRMSPAGYKRRILIVVDARLENAFADARRYFKIHQSAIDGFRLLSFPVSSVSKDMVSVLNIVEAAIEFKISTQDLILVLGGGTLLDIVGFAAAIYRGGIPYIRIPSTLLGMIDAGVGAKVGVNFEAHKNTIGRYYPPLACLNDPAAFLDTLPQREFACGLSEALKMGVIKSSRLFELIEGHHDGVKYNTHTEELVQLSIQTMLEELQPNMHELNLRRHVDFGHEFGHIVETLARYELPHGECVAIGMAISSTFAHIKGLLKQSDLDRILRCILSLGLPIHAKDHSCCNADILWEKISTEGTQHKDGMLYLSVPRTIGESTFIEEVSDLNLRMMRDVIERLERYPDGRKEAIHCKPNLKSEFTTEPVHRSKSEFLVGDTQSFSSLDPAPSSNAMPLIRTAAVIGASGDMGSRLTDYLLDQGLQVTCSVRCASLNKFKERTNSTHPGMHVVTGDVLNLVNLRTIIRQTDILYNMAAVVTLGAKPEEYVKVITTNGFAQGIITLLIREMGRQQDVKVVYPSSQRVHLTELDESVHSWVQEATAAFFEHQHDLLIDRDVYEETERFVKDFVHTHPIPSYHNIYEIAKCLGERFVSLLPRHCLMRISSVYGPTFVRGFIHRAIHPKPEGNFEAPEKRDFIYVDDLNEVLWKAAMVDTEDSKVFDGASGECVDLQDAWEIIREEIGDEPTLTFKSDVPQEILKPDPTFARKLLGRDFTPISLGLHKTVKGSIKERQDKLDRKKPLKESHLIAIDVGGTYMRIALVKPHGDIVGELTLTTSHSKQSNPEYTLSMLQEKLLEVIKREVCIIKNRHLDLLLEEVGIGFGGVITRGGIVKDASILWDQAAEGYDFKQAMLNTLPGMRLTILNDVSAAAWRYREEGRFCLITVSSGLANKVFSPDISTLDHLDLDGPGIGGEMGHVVVEPRAVDALVQEAISQAIANPTDFKHSVLHTLVGGDARTINAQHLGTAAKELDNFALRLLTEANIPYCQCGNLADLCSYSSGRGALQLARSLASRVDYGVKSDDITDSWLQQAIAQGHALGLKVLYDSTYPLALRVLQLAADIGIETFIIVGGFALKTARGSYLQAMQGHLVRLCVRTGFFRDWTDERVCKLVKLGINDNSDGLIGINNYMRHLHTQNRVVEKPVGKQSLVMTTRSVPSCGPRAIVTKVMYSGICATDLQILRGERGLEPVVLGHEGVCQVSEIGKDVKGLKVGDVILLNPNNPLDDDDKLGHTTEGLFQDNVIFDQDFIDRKQVLRLGESAVGAIYTLAEPLSTVIAAQDRIRDQVVNRNVLIVGAGTLGLLFVLVSMRMGARNVFLTNRSREKLDFAAARGVIKEERTFVASDDMCSSIDAASKGEGVDVVIICVSLGQGQSAAQRAVAYVNPGGCVYLFGGFVSGDTIQLDQDAKLEVWPIRTSWKTERIHVAGKAVNVSGHRGSRQRDLVAAVDMIRDHGSCFSKVISHIISFEMLPEVMMTLARGNLMEGMPAKKVIVEMGKQSRIAESLDEVPLRHLYEAAKKPRAAITKGNAFREVGFEGDSSGLDWVQPPVWREIQVALEAAIKINDLASRRHIIWIGTGGWTFLVDALKQLMPANQPVAFHTLQSLDPQALTCLFSHIEDLSTAVCLCISQSGKTIETALLMKAVKERFKSAGLNYQRHLVWLTDSPEASCGGRLGGVSPSSVGDDNWKNIETMPLTVNSQSSINALFCAPHSMMMFLPLFLLLSKDWKLTENTYQQYLTSRHQVAQQTLSKAYFVASNDIENFQVCLDKDITQAMQFLVVQLLEQALGSKQARFNPRIRVVSEGVQAPRNFENVAFPMPTEVSKVVKLMLTMNAISMFVAAVAYHKGIEFTTHPKVNLYKKRALELVEAGDVDEDHVGVKWTRDNIVACLQCHPQSSFVELLYYGHVPESYRQTTRNWIASCPTESIQHMTIEVADGEKWNHSRYQAAVQRDDTLYIILIMSEYHRSVEGVPLTLIEGNTRMLQAIARATYETLLPRALYLRIEEDLNA